MGEEEKAPLHADCVSIGPNVERPGDLSGVPRIIRTPRHDLETLLLKDACHLHSVLLSLASSCPGVHDDCTDQSNHTQLASIRLRGADHREHADAVPRRWLVRKRKREHQSGEGAFSRWTLSNLCCLPVPRNGGAA